MREIHYDHILQNKVYAQIRSSKYKNPFFHTTYITYFSNHTVVEKLTT